MNKKSRASSRRARMLDFSRKNKAVLSVYVLLRLIVIALLVYAVLNADYPSAFICILVLVLFMLPALVQKNFGVELPTVLQIVILVFIFAAEILGEISSYYVHYAHWDTILHTTWGFLCAAIGFSLVDLLNREKSIKFDLSPVFLALCAFCFSMTIGVIWEFFEFAVDYFFHSDMQKDTVISALSSVSLDPTLSNIPVRIENISDVAINGKSLGLGGYLDIGLYDTMEDLFVNFIGAFVFCVFGYIHVKRKGNSKIAKQFIPVVLDTDELAARDAAFNDQKLMDDTVANAEIASADAKTEEEEL